MLELNIISERKVYNRFLASGFLGLGTDFTLADNLVRFPFAKSNCEDVAQVDSWPPGDFLGVRGDCLARGTCHSGPSETCRSGPPAFSTATEEMRDLSASGLRS